MKKTKEEILDALDSLSTILEVQDDINCSSVTIRFSKTLPEEISFKEKAPTIPGFTGAICFNVPNGKNTRLLKYVYRLDSH